MEISVGEGEGVEMITRMLCAIADDWQHRARKLSCATIQDLCERLTRQYSEGVPAENNVR